jgi:hypothetical protein
MILLTVSRTPLSGDNNNNNNNLKGRGHIHTQNGIRTPEFQLGTELRLRGEKYFFFQKLPSLNIYMIY